VPPSAHAPIQRFRISSIWKRHPEFTARQVLKAFGTEHPLRLNWVRHILSDCWRGKYIPRRLWNGRPWAWRARQMARKKGLMIGAKSVPTSVQITGNAV